MVREAAAETAYAAGEYQIKVIGAAVPYEGGAAALYLRGALAPIITHTPPPSQVYGSAMTTRLAIQPQTAIGSGGARLFWAAGDSSVMVSGRNSIIGA